MPPCLLVNSGSSVFVTPTIVPFLFELLGHLFSFLKIILGIFVILVNLAIIVVFLFYLSSSRSSIAFEIIHADLWTSPVLSFTGFKYFLVLLDDFAHYVWTFTLRHKSDITNVFISFCTLVKTQFNVHVKTLQCDNGGEFQNCALTSFLS